MSNLQLDDLKSGIENGTEVTLKTSSDVVDDSNEENNFRYKLLLNITQVSRHGKAFASNFSANTKLSKTQLHKIQQSGGFLCRRIGPLLKNGCL